MSRIGDRLIFATGSYSGDDANDSVQIFDIPTADGEVGSWQTDSTSDDIDPAPVEVDSGQGGIIEGTLYIAGGEAGLGSDEGAVDATQAYDIQNNEWTQEAPMNTGVSGAGDAVFDGKLYIFGGGSDSGTVTRVQIYDPTSDTWSDGPSFPDTSGSITTAVSVTGQSEELNGIYVFGGGPDRDLTWRYNPSDDSWTTDIADLPAPRTKGGTAVLGEHIYLPAGSRDGDDRNTVVDRYNVVEDSWDQEPPETPYSAVRNAMTVSDGESVYLLGGGNSFRNKVISVYRYQPGDDSWTPLASLENGGADSAVVDVIPSSGGGQTTVSASMMTLQAIPGGEENTRKSSENGDPLNSALPEFLLESDRVAGQQVLNPVLDSWFQGDMTDAHFDDGTLEDDLEDALRGRRNKYSREPYRRFNNYRFDNGVTVEFDVSEDGEIDQDSLSIKFAEFGPDLDDPNAECEGRTTTSATVPPAEGYEFNHIPYDDWFDGDRIRDSNREDRYYWYNSNYEYDGVEGVRITTVAGGYAGFAAGLSAEVGRNIGTFTTEVFDLPNWLGTIGDLLADSTPTIGVSLQFFLDFIATFPPTYSVTELIVLADGRRFARVWDATPYPDLYLYVDGKQRRVDRMTFEQNERFNADLMRMQLLASSGFSPYKSPMDFYERLVDEDGGPIEDAIRDEVDQYGLDEVVPFGTAVSDILPNQPRMTVGYESRDGDALDNPSGPFGIANGLVFLPDSVISVPEYTTRGDWTIGTVEHENENI